MRLCLSRMFAEAAEEWMVKGVGSGHEGSGRDA